MKEIFGELKDFLISHFGRIGRDFMSPGYLLDHFIEKLCIIVNFKERNVGIDLQLTFILGMQLLFSCQSYSYWMAPFQLLIGNYVQKRTFVFLKDVSESDFFQINFSFKAELVFNKSQPKSLTF